MNIRHGKIRALALASLILADMPLAAQELRTYFVTSVCQGRRRLLQTDQSKRLFINILLENRQKNRMQLHAFVVMHDHVHLLLTPSHDLSLEKLIQFIKGGFSFRHPQKGAIWELGYFDKRVPDQNAYRACVEYIEQNPVKAEFCSASDEWPFSSRHHKLDPMPAWMQTRG